MYNILIVDDEKIERDGIKLFIKSNFDLNIFEAPNGPAALEFIKYNHLDILLTDIKMPVMDGLQLSRLAKEINPKLKVIILSAYGEFDYAKEAIDINVVGYILKPVKIKEFVSALTKVVEMCREEDLTEKKTEKLIKDYNRIISYEKEKLFLDMVNGTATTAEIAQRMTVSEVYFHNKYVVMILLNFKEKLFDDKFDQLIPVLARIIHINFEYVNINEYQSIIFLWNFENVPENTVLDEICRNIAQELSCKFNSKLCLVVSKAICELQEFHAEYTKMEQVLELEIFSNKNSIFHSSDDFTNILPSSMKRNDICGDTLAQRGVIKEVLNIIKSEYMNDISLEYVASRVYLAPSYLSYLFRKETGVNFIKYLTEIRLKKAKELLQDSNIKITDIGKMVGYPRTSYFYTLFKNYNGVTPAYFREKGENHLAGIRDE